MKYGCTKPLKTPASPAKCRLALRCIRSIKAWLFVVWSIYAACVPSTLAVQEAEQLYQPSCKTLMEYLGRGMIHPEVIPDLEPYSGITEPIL
jgi:hypothetical protein